MIPNRRLIRVMDICLWNDSMIARMAGVDRKTVRNWREGNSTIPPAMDEWLARFYDDLLRFPMPRVGLSQSLKPLHPMWASRRNDVKAEKITAGKGVFPAYTGS